MKQNVRIGLVLLAATMLLVLAAGNALATRDVESSCSTGASCHTDPSGLSITMASSIDVTPGETFQLDVTATGLASDVFVLRIPDSVDHNDDFTIVIPDNSDDPGLVSDNDANDQDPTANAIQTTYNITAPAFSGTFTLTVFAAQHTPSSTSASLIVNVASVGPGPDIGVPQKTPEVPLAGEAFTVSVAVTSSDTITYVRLQYSLDSGTTWEDITMTESDGVYVGIIPASVNSANNLEVLWRIVAADTSGTETISATQSYVVGQIPVEPIELPQFHYGWLLGAPALVLAYIGTALEYYDEERFTKAHGIMLSLAYILTTINVLSLFMEPTGAWTAMNPAYLINLSNMLLFVHSWHIWLGIVSMILGTLAFITHLGGWKTCNLGLPAVILWTILGLMGVYLGEVFVP
jgi:hypothetical protein